MMKLFVTLILIAAGSYPLAAQKIIRATPTQDEPKPPPGRVLQAPSAVPIKIAVDPGEVIGSVYRNRAFGFEVAFPENWRITSDDFSELARRQGYDLGLKAPEALAAQNRAQIERALKNVTVLLTAYRLPKAGEESAILRISIEDLYALPQVKDAVDYLDLMRAQFVSIKLAADFKYSETQAEKLGRKQFAYIDTSSNAGKKRLYAAVKNRQAIMFTLSYRSDDDLQTLRQVLAAGNFYLK